MEAYVDARLAEADRIAPERRAELDALARDVAGWARAGELPLVFVCTHNSRRSHLAQVWAEVAARRFGLDGVRAFSGGTEATALHPNAAAALERAGLAVERSDDSANPVYRVRVDATGEPLRLFSKVWSDPSNPREGFVAVMTCDAANEACPLIPGARARVPLTYADPKAFDGTDREAAGYDERCAQIARELLYLFARAAGAA